MSRLLNAVAVAVGLSSAIASATVAHGPGTSGVTAPERWPAVAVARPSAVHPRDDPGPMSDLGGPVQTSPRIYLDFWGWSGANADPDGERAYLARFYGALATSPWTKLLGQYSGAAKTVTYEGSWSDTTSAGPGAAPTGDAIAAEAENAVTHWNLSSGADQVNDEVVVALPNGVSFSNAVGGTACAYHTAITGNVPITALPYLADPPASGCGASVNDAHTLLDSLGEFAGHEFAESATDPYLGSWKDAGDGAEIADKCEFTNDSDVAGATGQVFAVQTLWSNEANDCELGLAPGARSWTSPASLGSATTAQVGPAMASSGGTTYEAFKSASSTKVYVRSNGGGGWGGAHQVTGATTDAKPAIAEVGGLIYVLWTSSVAPHHVEAAATGGLGGSWTVPVVVGAGAATSTTGPSVCQSENGLYAAYTTSSRLFVSILNGTTWSVGHREATGTSSVSPAIACSPTSSTELLAWASASNQLTTILFKAGAFVGTPRSIPGAFTKVAPSAALFAARTLSGGTSTWVVAYKGAANDDVYYVDDLASQPTAFAWSSPVQIPAALTVGSPTLASLTNDVTPTPAVGHDTLDAGWATTTGSIDLAVSNEPSPVGGPTTVLGAVLTSGPALAVTSQGPSSCKGTSHCYVAAWEGTSDSLLWSSAPQSAAQTSFTFGSPATITGLTSTAGPALGTLGGPGGQVYVSFMAPGGTVDVASLSGTTWSGATGLPNAATSTSPALVGGTIASGPSAGSYLFLAWKGEGTDERVFFAYMEKGVAGWTELGAVPGALTDDAPSLTINSGTLVLTWTDVGGASLSQNSMSLSSLGTWNTATTLGGEAGSRAGPSTTTTSWGTSYATWVAPSGSTALTDTFSTTMATLPQKQLAGVATSASPAILAAPSGPVVLVAWRDAATGDLIVAPYLNP